MISELPSNINNKSLVLIGFMGSGKSSIGKRLALELGYDYLDTDDLIVKKTGKSISEIFEHKGEAIFRAIESRVLEELLGKEKMILATGGGIVLSPKNKETLRLLGTVIWLHASTDTLFERARRNTKRPLLEVEHPRHTFNYLLESRLSAYHATHNVFVDTTNLSYAQTKSSILKAITKHHKETA